MRPLIAPDRSRYRSIFTSATRRERIANFEAYWAYCVGHDGEILQDQEDLVKKRDTLVGFQAHPRLQHHRARDAREELGALLLQAVVVALRTAFLGFDRQPGELR